MTNVAGKDDNGAPLIFGVSHRDGVTPIKIEFDPVTRSMYMDATTSIEFDPSINVNQNPLNYVPFAKATSISDDTTVMPWVVNEDTGAVIVEFL